MFLYFQDFVDVWSDVAIQERLWAIRGISKWEVVA